MDKQELGTFLRSRRERLRPEDVGLPSGSRRRTPGLRREEVAVLARQASPSKRTNRLPQHLALLLPVDRPGRWRLTAGARTGQ